MDAIEAEDDVLICAGTVAEALIVAGGRGLTDEMSTLIDELGFTIVPISATGAGRVADAYALAKERGGPLLYPGNDFASTDLTAA